MSHTNVFTARLSWLCLSNNRKISPQQNERAINLHIREQNVMILTNPLGQLIANNSQKVSEKPGIRRL